VSSTKRHLHEPSHFTKVPLPGQTVLKA